MEKDAELLGVLKKILDHPMTPAEIRHAVPKQHRDGVSRALRRLEDAGSIVQIRHGRYGLPDEMNLVTGRLQGHPDGYGFVLSEKEGQPDVFVGPRNFREAMHGDRVVCRVERTRNDGKAEGRIIRVLQRASVTITGVYQSRGRGGIIVPSHRRIVHDFHVPPGMTGRAKSGEVVVGKIISYPAEHAQAEAEITEILGHPDDPLVERRMIIRQHEIPEGFSPAAQRLAEKAAEPAEKDVAGRLDLRNEWVVTIDGDDAKDFDDAVSIKALRDGYELGVHIADVSNYVVPGTPLDAAALERATSTYFPGFVLPMLPFHLSDNVCSLRPHVDRLTLSVIIRFSSAGEIVSYKFSPSVIKSAHRMTYTGVARILSGADGGPGGPAAANLAMMRELCQKIYAKRVRDGGLDFDIPEPKITVNEKGEPLKVQPAERNVAHRLIEEFMLSANRCAANFLSDGDALYRIHPPPDDSAMEEFFQFAADLGYVTSPRQGVSFRLQEMLEKAHGHKDEKLLNYIMLRHMKQASYGPDNIGHFGLAFNEYTHFTSPIRRYPDLIVHRLIKQKLAGKPRFPDYAGLAELGAHCSDMERRSEKAERDNANMLMVRFMAGREGEEFDGVISGVTAFGIFVQLGGLLIEGLLRLTDLHDDYYDYHEKKHMLLGKRTGRSFRLGNPLRVRIRNVDTAKREMSLEPAEAPPAGRPGKAAKGKKGKDDRKEKKGKRRGRR